jgi:hypothetical protein
MARWVCGPVDGKAGRPTAGIDFAQLTGRVVAVVAAVAAADRVRARPEDSAELHGVGVPGTAPRQPLELRTAPHHGREGGRIASSGDELGVSTRDLAAANSAAVKSPLRYSSASSTSSRENDEISPSLSSSSDLNGRKCDSTV